MATRIYLPSSGAAPISPAFAAGWGITGSAARRGAVRTPSGTSHTTKTVAETSSAVVDVLIAQYVLADALAAQTISGTVKGQALAYESATGADARAQITIRVVSADGLTVRGTLLDFDTGALVDELSTAGENAQFPRGGAQALSPVAAQAGDYLVIEIGYRAHNTTSTSRSAGITFGDAAAGDLPEAFGGSSGAFARPWIEFSAALVFAGDPVPGLAALDSGEGMAVVGVATAFGAALLDGGGGLSAQGAQVLPVAVVLDGGGGAAVVGAGQVLGAAVLDGGGGAGAFGMQSRSGLSAAAVASAMAQETDEAWLLLLTIDHASLAEPIRVVGNHVNIDSRGDTYVAYPFSIDLPDDAPNEMPRVRLEVDNVGVPDDADPLARRVSDYLRAIDSPFTATLEVVLASQPDIVEAGPFELRCAKAEYDAATVSGDLTFEDVLNEPYPAGSFVPASHPGLF